MNRVFLLGLFLFGFTDFVVASSSLQEFKKVVKVLNRSRQIYYGGYHPNQDGSPSLVPAARDLLRKLQFRDSAFVRAYSMHVQDFDTSSAMKLMSISTKELWRLVVVAKKYPCLFTENSCGGKKLFEINNDPLKQGCLTDACSCLNYKRAREE